MISFNTLFSRKGLAHIFLVLSIAANASVQNALPEPKPVPSMQVIPLPYHQASFQRNGVEIARYHFGTARGGIVIAIKDQLDIPVKFVGLGEMLEDIAEFNPDTFVEALFN